jgi:hypothetical protein
MRRPFPSRQSQNRPLSPSKGDVHLQSTSTCEAFDRISEPLLRRFSLHHHVTRKVKVCSDFAETESLGLKSYMLADGASKNWSSLFEDPIQLRVKRQFEKPKLKVLVG